MLDYKTCYNLGYTQAETAKTLGVSREAVRQYANRYGLTFTKARQRGVPYGEFESMSEAARAEGVTPQAVWNRVNRVND